MPPFAVRRLLFVWLLLAGVLPPTAAQTATTNSLRRALPHTPPDSTRVLLLLQLAYTYRSSKPDSTYLAQEAWQLARRVAAEKWAFMGELSAGIAHELQNPLAFMQNFAEVSVALLDGDRAGAARPTGLEQKIMAGLKQNLREISQHGQRASAIITDMLAHARTGRSQREPTDLNALIAENLRLADHNHLALDGPAAIALRTDFATNLGLVPVVPQEMGRALLNLFTNALHAVRRRQQLGEPDYHPLVNVRTQRVDDAVEIRVRDNGTGMSEVVAAQVFQPFFTPKAASEGTGLGLSLAHDIVEGHQGTLMVETREGEFTELTVRVPA